MMHKTTLLSRWHHSYPIQQLDRTSTQCRFSSSSQSNRPRFSKDHCNHQFYALHNSCLLCRVSLAREEEYYVYNDLKMHSKTNLSQLSTPRSRTCTQHRLPRSRLSHHILRQERTMSGEWNETKWWWNILNSFDQHVLSCCLFQTFYFEPILWEWFSELKEAIGQSFRFGQFKIRTTGITQEKERKETYLMTPSFYPMQHGPTN